LEERVGILEHSLKTWKSKWEESTSENAKLQHMADEVERLKRGLDGEKEISAILRDHEIEVGQNMGEMNGKMQKMEQENYSLTMALSAADQKLSLLEASSHAKLEQWQRQGCDLNGMFTCVHVCIWCVCVCLVTV
jgi:hypothetical protein